LNEGDEGLGYVVDGSMYTTWDEIVSAFGKCRSAFDLIRHDSLDVEGYVVEPPPSRVCKYPVKCGNDLCGIETIFCCTNQAISDSPYCVTYSEILPARNGITIDIDQRTCTFP
jgi:hypothetical protein